MKLQAKKRAARNSDHLPVYDFYVVSEHHGERNPTRLAVATADKRPSRGASHEFYWVIEAQLESLGIFPRQESLAAVKRVVEEELISELSTTMSNERKP
jgi:hypothetical protein